MKLLLVASAGGHLAQLVALRPWWSQHDRHWVTFQKPDAVAALAGEQATWAHHPTTRNLPNLLRNLALSHRVLQAQRPDIVLTTGSGVGVPFVLAARARRIPSIYIEVIDRVRQPTLSGSLTYPFVNEVCIQWESQKVAYPDGHVIGHLL